MSQTADIINLVNDAKRNTVDMENLIEAYNAFILSEVSKASGRFVDTTEELYSVGLTGFQEAVIKYDTSKGAFVSFARLMIRSRCIDWIRKDSGARSREEAMEPHVLNELSIQSCTESQNLLLRKEEITRFKEVLSEWDLDMKTLIKKTPKSDKLKKLYQSMAQWILDNPQYVRQLKDQRRLPIDDLTKQFPINRKKLEQGKSYIIAMVIVYKGNFDMIKAYLR